MSDSTARPDADTHHGDDLARQEASEWGLMYQQLRALDAGPRARRRKFVAWEAVCQGCGDVLAEVVATRPYRALRFRGPRQPEQPLAGPVPLRRGGWTSIPLPAAEPPTAAATQVGPCVCRCQSWQPSLHHIFALLAAGTRKTTVPTSAQTMYA